MNHYHIRWANSKVDWQAFRTEDEAVAEAERLKRLDENYNIEECDGNCERCLRLIPNTRIAETGSVDGSEPGRSGRNGVQNRAGRRGTDRSAS
jgi:hypothetical protein